jgi:hypothetical protein
MRTRSRVLVLWFAAIFVVASSAIGFAKTASHQPKNHGPKVEATESPEPSETPEVENDSNQSQDQADTNNTNDRKLNHGFYVSAAAHCENVDDPATPASPDFTAPADCKTGGHGTYVSSVAKSSVGKPEGSHGPK